MNGLMLADLNIICINQQHASLFPNCGNLDIEKYDRNTSGDPVYWSDDFNTAHRLRGWWYTIYPKGNLFLERPFFDLCNDLECDLVRLYPEWQTVMSNILVYYIEKSPLRKVGVLIRAQDVTEDTVAGEFRLDEFLQMLIHGEVKYNTLYFLV